VPWTVVSETEEQRVESCDHVGTTEPLNGLVSVASCSCWGKTWRRGAPTVRIVDTNVVDGRLNRRRVRRERRDQRSLSDERLIRKYSQMKPATTTATKAADHVLPQIKSPTATQTKSAANRRLIQGCACPHSRARDISKRYG
jgi:hypothetical protein